VNGVAQVHLDGDGLTRQNLDKNLHADFCSRHRWRACVALVFGPPGRFGL
jgi:hypothetical protein